MFASMCVDSLDLIIVVSIILSSIVDGGWLRCRINSMKKLLLISALMLFASNGWAYSETDVAKLKATNACEGCDLSDRRWTDLRKAKLRGANLSGADLTYANLRFTKLSGANLSRADLSNAHLRGADLSNADLRDTKLSFADLTGANLSGADLRDAKLFFTNLSKANLTDVDLTTIGGIKNFTLDDAKFCRTKLPSGHYQEKYGDRQYADCENAD